MGTSFDFSGIQLEGDIEGESSVQEMLDAFALLKPKPSSFPFTRIGENCDGSYLIPDDLDGIVACFSPGVNNFKHFEDILTDRHGIDCHMCDFSSDLENFRTPLKEGRQTFRKKWLDVRTEDDSLSLDDWVSECAPEGDLLLQMDIEGAEYRNLLSTADATLSRFKIVVLEVHDLDQMRRALVLRNVIAPVLTRLAQFFTVVHAHPNNCCGDFAIPGTSVRIPKVLELTYVRTNGLTARRYTPMLPHPMDVSRNVLWNPPLFLGEDWLDGNRPLRSRIKMTADTARYHSQTLHSSVQHQLARVKRLLRRYVPQP